MGPSLIIKIFQFPSAAGTSALNPANKAGRGTATTATSGAPTRRTGLMRRTSAKRRADTWPPSPPMPPSNIWKRRWREQVKIFGLEAMTLKRRAPGSGQTALRGNSYSQKTIGSPEDLRTVWNGSWKEDGTTTSATRPKNLCAPKEFVRVKC